MNFLRDYVFWAGWAKIEGRRHHRTTSTSWVALAVARWPPILVSSAMADDTSMGGHLATARATQLVDVVR